MGLAASVGRSDACSCKHDLVLWLAVQRFLAVAVRASCFRRFEARLAAFSAKSRELWPFRLNFFEFRHFSGRLFALSLEYLILFKFFEIFGFFRRKCWPPPFSRRSSFQRRAAPAVLKSKLILAFVDADWVGGAAALVQFLRSDDLLARRIIASMEQVALADSRERIDYA